MAGEFASRERVIELLRTLVSVRSPYFEEDEIMDVVCAWLNGHGLPARIHEYYEPKETQFHGKNVVGALTGNRPGPTIYLGGHLDTVKLCHGWTRPPFEGVVEGDRLYGVGALDMKSGDTAIMLALEEFVKQHGDDFAGKIIYQFVSDEEGPFGLGTAAAIQENVDGLKEHMKKQANYLRPKFDVALAGLQSGLGGLGVGEWTHPNGGYFISFQGLPGTAKRCVELCDAAGVKLTAAGSVYPYGIDPEDSNIRIAPSYPSTEQLYQSINVFCICQRIAALEALEG